MISICLPTYNRAALLKERAIPTVLAQTSTDWELIVVDDQSTDNTRDVVRGFDDDRIKYCRTVNDRYARYPQTAENHWLAGPVVALNAALKHVKGDWIARIDDDDLWTPDHLERLLTFALNHGYEFVSSHYATDLEGKNIVRGHIVGGVQTWLYRASLPYRYDINCWRKSHNRVNDLDISERMVRGGVKMGYLPEVTAFVLPRPGETEVGSKAYLADPAKTEEFYK